MRVAESSRGVCHAMRENSPSRGSGALGGTVAAPAGPAHDVRMIPELHISKVKSGLYEARLHDGNEEIFESTMHDSISGAIRDVASDFPDELADFLEVRYVDVSIGTQALTMMRAEPDALASKLVDLAAAVWRAEEERDFKHRVVA